MEDMKIQLEVLCREGRTYLNYWDVNGRDVVAQIVDGQIQRWKHSEDEAWDAEDPFEHDVLTIEEFINEVKRAAASE